MSRFYSSKGLLSKVDIGDMRKSSALLRDFCGRRSRCESDDDFASRVLAKSGSKEKQIVVYCASAECDSSTKAVQKLLDAGFEDVWDFEEGAQGWRDFVAKKGVGYSRRAM